MANYDDQQTCPHVSGGELVCYFEDKDGKENRHILICSMCNGRFELIEKFKAIVEKWKSHYANDSSGIHEAECCVGELVQELDDAFNGLS